jgi:hypothetical protein
MTFDGIIKDTKRLEKEVVDRRLELRTLGLLVLRFGNNMKVKILGTQVLNNSV